MPYICFPSQRLTSTCLCTTTNRTHLEAIFIQPVTFMTHIASHILHILTSFTSFVLALLVSLLIERRHACLRLGHVAHSGALSLSPSQMHKISLPKCSRTPAAVPGSQGLRPALAAQSASPVPAGCCHANVVNVTFMSAESRLRSHETGDLLKQVRVGQC